MSTSIINNMIKGKTCKAWHWKVKTFSLVVLLLMAFGQIIGKDQNRQVNQLDTIISGKRLIVKDTTQYSSSFIKGLKTLPNAYENLIVKDDSFLITYTINNGRKDTVVSSKYTIPTNLELNREIVFQHAIRINP